MTRPDKKDPFTNLKKIEETIKPYCRPRFKIKRYGDEKWDIRRISLENELR